MQSFKANDLVWAKLKGFPYWPGKIADLETMPEKTKSSLKLGTNSVAIYFMESRTYASVAENSIQNYEENRETNIKSQQKPKKNFLEAVKIAEEEFEKIKGSDYVPIEIAVKTPKRTSTKPQKPTPLKKSESPEKESPPRAESPAKTANSQSSPIKTNDQEETGEKAANESEVKASPSKPSQWGTPRAVSKAPVDYTRTPFESRKRTTGVVEKETSPVKKSKIDDDLTSTLVSHSHSETFNHRIGLVGSGLLYRALIQAFENRNTKAVFLADTTSTSALFKTCQSRSDVKDVIDESDAILICFSDQKEQNQFFFGSTKVFPQFAQKLIVNLTPFTKQNSKSVEAECVRIDSKYLECSMMNFKDHASVTRGEFQLIACGKSEVFSSAEPILRFLTKEVTSVGDKIGTAIDIHTSLLIAHAGHVAAFFEISKWLQKENSDAWSEFLKFAPSSTYISTQLASSIGKIEKGYSQKTATNAREVEHHLEAFRKSSKNIDSPMVLTNILPELFKINHDL